MKTSGTRDAIYWASLESWAKAEEESRHRADVRELSNNELIDAYMEFAMGDCSYDDEAYYRNMEIYCMSEMKRRGFDFTWLEEHNRHERERQKVLNKASGHWENRRFVIDDKALADEFCELERLADEAISSWKIAVMEDSMYE